MLCSAFHSAYLSACDWLGDTGLGQSYAFGVSLIDPQEAQARKNATFVGKPSALVATLILGLSLILAAGVIGFALGSVVDQFRVMNINSVFGNWDTAIPVAVRGWGLPLGILSSIVIVGQYEKWNNRYSGKNHYYVFLGPLTLILLGLAAGSWLSTTMWTEPDAVGTAVDPVFSHDEPWGIGAWVFYAAKWWLPGVLVFLALLSLWGRFASQKRRRRSEQMISTLLDEGTLTDAEVVQAPLPVPNTSRMTASFTVKFHDINGDQRWVTCSAILRPSQVPPVGSSRPLLFDPKDPEDTNRIFFSPSGGVSPEDFYPAVPST